MRLHVPTLLNTSLILSLVTFFLLSGCVVTKLQKISVDALNNQMDNANVTIIDVRQGGDWQKSQFKIKGAVRENPYSAASWADKYPKNRKIVLYCS